jgi:hypothetical protein
MSTRRLSVNDFKRINNESYIRITLSNLAALISAGQRASSFYLTVHATPTRSSSKHCSVSSCTSWLGCGRLGGWVPAHSPDGDLVPQGTICRVTASSRESTKIQGRVSHAGSIRLVTGHQYFSLRTNQPTATSQQ